MYDIAHNLLPGIGSRVCYGGDYLKATATSAAWWSDDMQRQQDTRENMVGTVVGFGYITHGVDQYATPLAIVRWDKFDSAAVQELCGTKGDRDLVHPDNLDYYTPWDEQEC